MLNEPAGTLIQNAEFTNGVSRGSDHKNRTMPPSFVLNADGSISALHTPQSGYISAGSDPEDGTPNDRFTYELTGPNGTSSNAVVEIVVAAPAPPTVDTPTATNITATTATLGGIVESDGGAGIAGIGVVYAPTAVNTAPQIGGAGVNTATGSPARRVSLRSMSGGLTPDTDYSYEGLCNHSGEGVSYSLTGSFTTLATPQSWQRDMVFSVRTSLVPHLMRILITRAVQNIAVFAFLGPYQFGPALSA